MRQGIYINNLSGELAYKSFRPAPLPPEPAVVVESGTDTSLLKAHLALSKLKGSAEFVPNINLYLSMYIRKEALFSSQLEGTQCTFDDIFDPRMPENIAHEVADVANYVKATEYAIARMEELPLCNRLFRETHEVLMSGVRGQEKYPGQFRVSQNWIGPAGCGLSRALFIPPNVEDMNDAMNDLENFINTEDDLDPLVKAALIHYQFETIHPFLDGNGRVGRLLITLFLLHEKIIDAPIIYPSLELKLNQTDYYYRLTGVRAKGDYESWVEFFLDCLQKSATDSFESIARLSRLSTGTREAVSRIKKPERALRLLEYLERQPIVDIASVATELGVARATAVGLIDDFVEAGFLKQSAGNLRYREYSYEPYLEILRGD